MTCTTDVNLYISSQESTINKNKDVACMPFYLGDLIYYQVVDGLSEFYEGIVTVVHVLPPKNTLSSMDSILGIWHCKPPLYQLS